ncbi:MAG TPA: NAD(+)/NADH kinase [Pseudomonadales bacterium]
MLTFGLLINPVAGLGGPPGLKGSDGAAIQQEARARGGRPRGAERTLRALAAAGPAARQVRWLTCAGEMGADVLEAAGVPAEVVATPRRPSGPEDTHRATAAIAAAGADLLVFAGGDGTARDVLEALGDALPVLGIPAGVKMHSGVFAATPEAAGRILRALVEGGLVRASVAAVRDLDEDALRAGIVQPRFYGELAVPEAGGFLQHTKEGGRESEPLALEEIVADVVERLAEWQAHPAGICVLGGGGTLKAIKDALGIDGTLIGIDVLHAGRQVGRDVDARWLERYLAEHAEPAVLVLTFTRRQGFLIGRGNQPLTPTVLRRIGREHLWVVGTRTKLQSLEGRPLLIDTDDPGLDREWSGLIRIITGYQDSLYYRVESGA